MVVPTQISLYKFEAVVFSDKALKSSTCFKIVSMVKVSVMPKLG